MVGQGGGGAKRERAGWRAVGRGGGGARAKQARAGHWIDWYLEPGGAIAKLALATMRFAHLVQAYREGGTVCGGSKRW